MTVFQDQCFIIYKISKENFRGFARWRIGGDWSMPKRTSIRLRKSWLIIMIIRNIFVFTLALSDLLLTASVPFTVLDALTQVQVFMLNKCNTMFSKYVDLFTTSQSVRKVPKYSSRHSSFSSFLHPAGMASSLFAFRVQVFLIVKHSCCTAILLTYDQKDSSYSTGLDQVKCNVNI